MTTAEIVKVDLAGMRVSGEGARKEKTVDNGRGQIRITGTSNTVWLRGLNFGFPGLGNPRSRNREVNTRGEHDGYEGLAPPYDEAMRMQ